MNKPILFNTDMVKAIQSGRKTVTRRLVKPKYKDNEYSYSICRRALDNTIAYIAYTDEDGAMTRDMKPPYNVGDILYVRETWAKIPGASSKGGYAYKYKASDEGSYWDSVKGFKWRPSIHMPKDAVRIWLKVTDVRVEKLQDMTIDDALHEGSDISQGFKDFIGIWDATVSTKDINLYGWDANPWVWVVEFEKTEGIAS